ncbi:AMP-dependent synthetase/ligase [Streptomyces sp. NBC_01264]|uniref:AMP-dependent synthetase/ligase n=1 Tax=Streptomyces sp. NBC_01264 TaxID=2903804 RepID=UPI00224E7AA5|nr:AMP-dependent synthetase/ligase [Streptomyces sp. NBC_01264]MCX4780309.1 AMP-dependent synthetase/ligase [Streptomyces sp. NBC_01264]
MSPMESVSGTDGAVRPRTLAVFAEWTGERYAGEIALRHKGGGGGERGEPGEGVEGGGWGAVSYGQLRSRVRESGRALLGLGVAPGERVAVLAETRPEWTYTHFGVLAAGAVLVPVYPTAGEEELAWVLSDSAAVVVVCDDHAQAARVEALRAKLPGLRAVVEMDELRALHGRASEAELLARAAAVEPAADASIVYTSGTTGLPKGCRLTHANLGAIQDATLPLVKGGPGDSTYLYLPLAHLLAQLIQFTTLLEGGELCYFGGRIEDVIGELAEARPTHLPSVPRLFEKLHSVVLSLAESQEGGGARFTEAVRVGLLAAEGRLEAEDRGAYEAAEKTLYSLVRGAFGGRLKWALTGGAPIAPATLDFLRACGIAVFEGYGMTESAGVISLNHPDEVRYGSVGRPIAGCEVRIAEDGEVLARGPMIFPGYHANDAATAEALDGEGWLHTGDLGEVDAEGFLSITGRKKELIITSAGKNITPTEWEFAVQRSRYVSRAVMIGDRRPHPVALITLDAEEIAAWAVRESVSLDAGASGDPGGHPAVRALVAEAVEAANATVSRPARVRAFRVLPGEFAVEAGTLTPTLKLRRRAVAERYAGEIEGLYG